MASFTTRNQTELRKLLEMVYDAVVAEASGFKFIEEQGAAADSGTVLSGSSIVATVASQDGDIVNSANSVLVGGLDNTLNGANEAVIVGGSGNTIDGNSSVIVGSDDSTATGQSTIIGAVDATNDCVVRGSVIVGGTGNVLEESAFYAVALGGAVSTIDATGAVTVGSNTYGHRPYGLFVGGAQYVGVRSDLNQTCIKAGSVSTSNAAPARIAWEGTGNDITVLPNSTLNIVLSVNAVNESTMDSYGIIKTIVARRIGTGDVVVVYDSVLDSGGDASLAAIVVDADANGAALVTFVTGIAATYISWVGTATITEQRIPVEQGQEPS